MTGQPWTKKEIGSFLSTLRRSSTLREATLKHNRKWRNSRSQDAITHMMLRNGLKATDYMRPEKVEVYPESEQIKSVVLFLKRRPSAKIGEICDALDLCPRRLRALVVSAREQNYQISAPSDDTLSLSLSAPPVDRLAVHRIAIEPIRDHVVFGVASDIHCASKLHRSECLVDFVDLAMSEYGVRKIFVPGDVTAGINMYHGQSGELEQWGMENQTDLAAKQIPMREGLEWEIIGGNHDESLIKAAGADTIKCLARKRPDIHEHGFYSALIDLAVPRSKRPIKIELFHPDKAGAYALSYHVQKAIEQIPGGMKPQLLFVGHEHTSLWMPDYRGISAFNSGTFEDQSLYLKRKHIQPAIGGWIIDIGVTSSGEIRSLTPTWVRYFHSRRGSLSVAGGDDSMDRKIGLPC